MRWVSNQACVLIAVARGHKTLSAIKDLRWIREGSLPATISALEKADLVTTALITSGKRRKEIALTKEGHEALSEIQKEVVALYPRSTEKIDSFDAQRDITAEALQDILSPIIYKLFPNLPHELHENLRVPTLATLANWTDDERKLAAAWAVDERLYGQGKPLPTALSHWVDEQMLILMEDED